MTDSDTAGTINQPPLPADSLAAGVAVMLSMTVVQRIVGFSRSILFCRMLTDEQLGMWSLAFSFLLLAAPLAVLGLPGSFGRYVQYYHSRGQLRMFLWRTAAVSAVLGISCAVLAALGGRWMSWVIFKDASQTRLTLLLAGALVAVIAFNFLNELLTALRQARASACLQFTHSLLFAVVGVGLMVYAGWGVSALVTAYIAGCVVAGAGAVLVLARTLKHLPADAAALPHRTLWGKLLPFAGWIWVINILANLFDAADRYMILHFGPFTAAEAQGLVGQYHSSRVTPLLLSSVAALLAGIVVPYLSHDWEAGRRLLVSRKLRLALKLTSISFTVGGALLLLASPLLFDWALQGKYSNGLSVLPLTMTYCVWLSLATIAQTYLWCAEKARLGGLALFAGLIANIACNAILLPWLGLMGAVLATAVANLVSLTLIMALNYRSGMKLDPGVWLALAVPASLALGALPAMAFAAGAIVFAMRHRWLLSRSEQREITAVLEMLQTRLRRLTSSYGAAANEMG